MAEHKLPNDEIITAEDFSFVQKDASLHDKKFQTRPTTFFKDAMKRFVKNKSSVVAAGILAVLILMAIIVPIADRNDITTNVQEVQYLPPKWFSGNANGFMDGTKRVTDIVLDPFEKDKDGNYVVPADSNYVQNAIIGNIDAYSSYSDSLTQGVKKYGKNGSIEIANVGNTDRVTQEWSTDGPAGISSPEVTFADTETVSFSAVLDLEASKASLIENSELSVSLAFEVASGGNTQEVTLAGPLMVQDATEGVLACDDVVTAIKNDGIADADIKGRFITYVNVPSEAKFTTEKVYVKSLTAKASASDLSKASFSNATKALSDLEDKVDGAYTRFGQAKLNIHRSEVLYGSFRYDYYKATFGSTDDNDPKPVFSQWRYSSYDVQQFIDRGWMTYEWGHDTQLGVFTLTEAGKTYCPIRSVVSQRYEEDPFHPGDPEYEIKELTANVSFYRHLYYEGRIADCKPPMYFFGTNARGLDFFKVVFSGLLVSLGLGFLSAGINIIIGLIWGAIAGYFGGWVDLLMERFVEILGGMPWIVMMTLIVLLTGSNSFGIFLLALCITGWIGISGTTRSQFYRYKRREYVLASRTLGASDARLIFRHILPNAIGTIVTSAVLMIPSVIFTEANIAYLLPGTMQLSGSFGVTLSDVQADLTLYPYLIVSASIVMALIMISFNLFGNGLRDAFNPSLKGADE